MKQYYRRRPKFRPKAPSFLFGKIAIIVGIIGFFFMGLIVGTLAIIFGFLGVARDHSPTLGVIGVILGVIDVAIVAIFLSWFL